MVDDMIQFRFCFCRIRPSVRGTPSRNMPPCVLRKASLFWASSRSELAPDPGPLPHIWSAISCSRARVPPPCSSAATELVVGDQLLAVDGLVILDHDLAVLLHAPLRILDDQPRLLDKGAGGFDLALMCRTSSTTSAMSRNTAGDIGSFLGARVCTIVLMKLALLMLLAATYTAKEWLSSPW